MDVQEDLCWYVSVKALKSGSVAHVQVVRCSNWDKLRGRVLASAKCVIWLLRGHELTSETIFVDSCAVAFASSNRGFN